MSRPGTYSEDVKGTSSGFEAVDAEMPDAMEERQSRNLDWAVRSDWNELERWVSSASSWVFSSWSWGTGSDVNSTALCQLSPILQQVGDFREAYFGRVGRLEKPLCDVWRGVWAAGVAN